MRIPVRRLIGLLSLVLLKSNAGAVSPSFGPASYSTQNFGSPVDDRALHSFALADLLEYRPKGSDSDARWDIKGWTGGDYNRLWFRSEGLHSIASKSAYNADFELLYGRFVGRYYDIQVGARAETQRFEQRNVARGHAVIALTGLSPYGFEVEPEFFVSQKGDVSARFTAAKDLMVTQRWVLQPRLDTSVAAQKVPEFTTGSGLNNVELGLRLRYEIRRELAPYVGITFERSFAETASLVRQEGGDPSQFRFVLGARLWF